jgi:hypothetical protein
MGRRHSEKIQMRVGISVAHDRKPGNVIVNACDEYVNIGGANTRCYPQGFPTPLETVLD